MYASRSGAFKSWRQRMRSATRALACDPPPDVLPHSANFAGVIESCTGRRLVLTERRRAANFRQALSFGPTNRTSSESASWCGRLTRVYVAILAPMIGAPQLAGSLAIARRSTPWLQSALFVARDPHRTLTRQSAVGAIGSRSGRSVRCRPVHCSFDPTDCSSAEQAQGRCNDSTGAGTNLAAQPVINAPPDGHTLLFVTPVNAINATLYSGLPFDFMRDVAAVAGIVTVPFVLQVTPSFPANNVAELIAYAKANPGKISMASAGIGSVPHMAGELFKLMASVRPWLCENVLPPMIPAV
jgi:hypothetical protein